MIARLKGSLEGRREDAAVIDVGGVGYLVYSPARTLDRLGAPGDPVALHVETHVREDRIHLYGFATEAERRCFQLLQTVQGVGARAALAILSALAPDDLARAVAAGDRAMLTRAEGIGPRLAGRIVNELKDKAAFAGPALGPAADAGGTGANGSAPPEDAVSALVNLGYGRTEAYGAVAAAMAALGPGAPLDRLVAASLREAGS